MSPLLSSRFILIAIFRQVSLYLPPSFLPSRRSPPPLLRRESWAREVSTQEPKLSTSSESPCRRATAREREPRRNRAGRPAQHQRQCGLSSQEELRLQARLSAPASPNAPGRRERIKRLCGTQGQETAAETSYRRCFVQPGAQRTRRERARRGSAEGAGSPRRCPPALRLCAAFGSSTEEPVALERQGGITPAAGRNGFHRRGWRQRKAASEREPAGKEATRPRPWDARSEGARSRAGGLSAAIKPPGCRLQLNLSAELGLANSPLPGLSPTLSPPPLPALPKLGCTSAPQQSVGICPCLWVLPFQQVSS